ncbi:Cubilin [Lamellibrachia satsuma]|nr:Cubilin [Lamellibrachia satsuma]
MSPLLLSNTSRGDSYAGAVIGRYCGSDTLPPVIISPSTHLWIRFISDHSVAADGFQLQYTLNRCGGRMFVPSGQITSPPHNTSYDCAWHIMAPLGHQIKLHFNNLSLSGAQPCEDAYVEILNGEFATSPSIGHFCGNTPPADFLSQTNQLRVIFHNNGISSPPRTFNLQFTSQAAGCGGMIHAQHGTVTSPNRPQLYPYNIECQWDINVQQGYHVRLAFLPPFDLEIGNQCTHDYVQITDSLQEAQTYCGNEMPPHYNSSDNSLSLKFVSDARHRGNGFAAVFTVGCGATYIGSEGTFTSPGFPQNYANNLHCAYTIFADNERDHILLNFDPDTFHVEGSERSKPPTSSAPTNTTSAPSVAPPTRSFLSSHQHHSGGRTPHHSAGVRCRYDYIEAFAGNSSSASSLGRICGSVAPQEVWSVGSMHIVFVTDHTITDQGWVAHYRTSTCGGELTDPFGSFQSQSSRDQYHHKSNCTWTITVDPTRSVELKFTRFDLEASSRCTYDYVAVYDGLDSSSLIGQYCGSVTPLKIVSTSNTLLVNFVTDSSVSKEGFHAAYRSVFGPNQGCGGVLNMTTGVITSLDHSGNGRYEPDLGCIWQIIVPENDNVRLRFDRFDLAPQGGAECIDQFDYLEVHDGFFSVEPLLGIYCGSNKPSEIVSSQNSLFVKFVSDESDERSGFQLHFDAIKNECGGTLWATTEPQTLASVHNDTSKLRCHWLLDATATNQIHVQFTNIDVVEDPECIRDYVSLRDVPMTSTGRSIHYCGSTVPAEFISGGHAVQVSFVTDASRASQGFTLTYQIAGCNRTYTGESGHISSPGWPGNYPVKALCDITVAGPEGSSIALFFNMFNVETHRSCRYDHLQVYNGTGDDAVVMATLCGSTVPNPIFLTTNSTWMRFITDESRQMHGFDITYISSVDGR